MNRRSEENDSAVPAAVLDAIDRGWSVIPVGRDKTPLLPSWKPYQRQGATRSDVERWQRELEPSAWATVTGQISGVVVLDCDGPAGLETLRTLGLKPHVQTGSGGCHVYFQHPGWPVPTLNGKTKRSLGESYPGLDIRADGGYAIFCGRNSQGTYKLVRPLTPYGVDQLPKKLRKLFGLQKPAQANANPDASLANIKAPNLLLDKAWEKVSSQGRNNSGFWLACQLRDQGYPFKDAARLIRQYAAGVTEVNQKGQIEPYTAAEALASLQQAYSRQPRSTPDQLYFATDQGLFWRRPGRDGESIVQLSNFGARIVTDVIQDDGVEMNRKLTIVATLNGRRQTVTVTARDFPSMGWVCEALGPSAVIFAGYGAKDHCRAAIQVLSPEIKKSRTYTHTGWRRIGRNWYYLHGAGAIGGEGSVAVQVALPSDLSPFNLPDPPAGADLNKAIRASLSILRLGPPRIIVPFYCSIWRAAIGASNFSIHLTGPTGTFKTCLSALGQQHWGEGFSFQNVPASWSATENALEAFQFILKDAVLVIDDFAPRGNKSDVERWHQKADRVLRGQGNRAGRARMKPDSSLRATKKARGTTLSSGEDAPKGESLKARVLILEIDRNTIDPDRLSRSQELGAAGLFSAAMSAFVSWVAPQYEEIMAKLPSRIASLRQKAESSNQHRRTPEVVANLMCGLNLFLRFCSEKDVLSDEEVDKIRRDAWEALGLAAAAQAREQRTDEPAGRFVDLLSAALASGEAHVRPAGNKNSTREYSGRCVGWIDGDYVLLEPDSSFAEAQRIGAQQGETLPVAKNTLWKRLREKGFLVRSEKGRNLVKWPVRGVERRVLCMLATTLRLANSGEVAN